MHDDMILGETSMWTLLERRAARTPDKVALRDGAGRTLTFLGLTEAAAATAERLGDLGVRAGQVVSWQLPTRISTVVLSAALCRLGALQSPVIPQFREHELVSVLRGSRACTLVVQPQWGGTDYLDAARRVRGTLDGQFGIVALRDDIDGLPVLSAPDGPERAGAPPEVPAGWAGTPWIFTTSGTAAAPKGVRHSDRSMITIIEAWAQRVGFDARCVAGVAFPWAHAGGTMFLATLGVTGGEVVVLERFAPAEAVRILADAKVTVMGGSTVFYQALLDEQRRRPGAPVIPTLQVMIGGGAPMPPGLYFDVKREMGVVILHGYGASELGSITVGAREDTDDDLAHTVGPPLPPVLLRIRRSDGVEAAPGEDGEFELGGEALFAGYTDPQLDAQCFTPDGYFKTGDVGHRRADGRVVVTGRIKDIIIRKGENISALEVEGVLAAHPKVAAAAVIGVPDAASGERVCAVVEPSDPAQPITFDEMVEHFRRAGTMPQKIPEQLECVDAMPRGGTFSKIDKKVLRARFGA